MPGSLVGEQTATFVNSLTVPTYELVVDEDAGIVSMQEISGTGSSGLQLASYYRIASAVKKYDIMTPTTLYVYLKKGTFANLWVQLANGDGVKSDWMYPFFVPEPITFSFLSFGVLALIRRKFD
jgi:hypothetical protein